jgi:hypothetical protein
MSQPLDLAEFRLLRALKSGLGGAAFLQLWNAQAGATWSVFRALVDRDADAVGWMASFRLDLHERAVRLRADQPLAPQVGEALYEHALASFAGGGPLPSGPLTPDENGVRALPASTRLAYLVDLFFDWTAPDPRLRDAYRLLEPAEDTDARLLVHTALMRTAPAETLLFPPGSEPISVHVGPRKGSRFRLFSLLVGLLGGAAIAAAWVVRAPVPLRLHQRALARPVAAPDATCVTELQGLPERLQACVDLHGIGLTRVGSGVDEGTAVLVYDNEEVTFSLQHRMGGLAGVPEREPTRPTRVGEVSWVSWREGATSYTLAARTAPDRVLGTAMAILADTAPAE